MSREYYSENLEIMSHDVDGNNNARPSIIARLMQETANHHMRDRRPTYYELFQEGKSYILVRFACELIEQLHPYDKVEVRTWTCEPKGATFKRNYEIVKEDRIIAKAYSEWAVVDIKSDRILRANQVDHKNYERGDQIELLIPIKFHFADSHEFKHVGHKHVGYTDCDMNMHMNNTHYQDMLWDYIPEVQDKKMTAFSLRFMAEAHMGSNIEIEMAESDLIPDASGGKETWMFRTEVGGRQNVEAIINTSDCRNDEPWKY